MLILVVNVFVGCSVLAVNNVSYFLLLFVYTFSELHVFSFSVRPGEMVTDTRSNRCFSR